jgi:hypothetical protein
MSPIHRRFDRRRRRAGAGFPVTAAPLPLARSVNAARISFCSPSVWEESSPSVVRQVHEPLPRVSDLVTKNALGLFGFDQRAFDPSSTV